MWSYFNFSLTKAQASLIVLVSIILIKIDLNKMCLYYFILGIILEIMVRFCCFLVVTAIFTMMDCGDGLTKLQLKITLIVWLMSAIHCGAISLYPFHTLVILSITVSPMIEKLTGMLNISDEIE